VQKKSPLKVVPASKCVAKGEQSRDQKVRASRSSTLPPPPEDRTLVYAACREELQGIEPGEIVLAVEELEGFRVVVGPALEAVDKVRLDPKPGEGKRRGRKPSFHALDYWRLEMLRRVIASHSTQDTRDWLTTDKAKRTRELLGFDQPRVHYGGRARKWMEGIPSDGWMSDFRTKWLPEAELAQLMEQLECWALTEKMTTLPGMREGCQTLYADGSKLETHATPPKYDENKVLVNEWRTDRHGNRVRGFTAPEAGYISPQECGSPDHSGAGWNIVFVMSSKGTVLGHRNVPMHTGEIPTLTELVPEIGQTLDVLGEPELRVLTTDAGFHSQTTRKALREIGVLENTHLSSASNAPSTQKSAEKRTLNRFKIDGYPKWRATGDREIVCECGQGKTSRLAGLDPKTGKARARIKGECSDCGSILITSGLWRLSPSRGFVKCLPHEHDRAEWNFGNPLTFTDPLAIQYGRRRFNSQEGAFGSQFTQRFKLLKSKRWFYRQTQVNLEVSAVITITHALSLERHRRMRLMTGAAPPEALAA